MRFPAYSPPLGLLGTFVGIAIGLAGIPDGTSGGVPSAEDLSQSINTLMGGMSTAFSTSIIGITGSIWWLFEFPTGSANARLAACEIRRCRRSLVAP